MGEVLVEAHTRKLTAPVTEGATSLMAALRRLDSEQIGVLDVGLRRPTLDDVFLTLTGHAAELSDSDESEADRTPSQDARIEELAR